MRKRKKRTKLAIPGETIAVIFSISIISPSNNNIYISLQSQK